MARCSNCGCRYNEDDVKDKLWAVCGIYSDRLFDGLCYSCGIEAWNEENDTDIEDEVDEMSDEEFEERSKDSFIYRYQTDDDFRRRFS